MPNRRARRRRARRRHRAVVAVLAALAIVLAGGGVVLLAGGSGDGSSAARVETAAARPAVPSSTTTTTAPPTTTTTVDPGTLPQTDVKPDPSSAAFQAQARLLWDAIVADDPDRVLGFFFPLSAYVQVKAISNPTSDWNTRLVAAFRDDVHAWHARLGAGAASAQYVGATVPDTAQWVLPGAEYNQGSYWRVYGATLRYQTAAGAGSFTIASMISWRGAWYVVHLASIR